MRGRQRPFHDASGSYRCSDLCRLDPAEDASTSSGKDRRQGIFADRSFWRRARQIACFQYTCERLRNNVNTFWKERLADAIDGRERARAQAKEIYLVVCRLRGLEEAVNRQCELLAFRHALRDRREAEAALTTKLHRQFRAGDNGPHAFWSIYHKEDSKWMLPAPSSITGKQEQKEPYKPAYNRQLPDAKLVANPGAQESEPSSHGHASLNSKRSQAARKVTSLALGCRGSFSIGGTSIKRVLAGVLEITHHSESTLARDLIAGCSWGWGVRQRELQVEGAMTLAEPPEKPGGNGVVQAAAAIPSRGLMPSVAWITSTWSRAQVLVRSEDTLTLAGFLNPPVERSVPRARGLKMGMGWDERRHGGSKGGMGETMGSTRYNLNLAQPSDFAVAELLKMLDAWESSVAKAKGLEDRSKYGNWSSVRNCVHQSITVRSLTEWILPCSELLFLDFVTWRRPAKDTTTFPAERWDEMMVQLAQAPLQQEAKVHVLRGLADRIYLSAAQCRQLVAVFGDRTFRLEALTFLLLRLSDPQNMKMIVSRIAPDEWDELKLRLGTLTLFPYIQPEQYRFVFDTTIPEDRLAACLTVRMNLKESPGRLGNLRQPRLVLTDKSEFAFDRGVPATWKDLQTIPNGLLSWQYMAAPEDRSLDMRIENLLRYGGWNTEIQSSKVIWWADVQAVPEAVSTFLVHVMRHFKHNLRAAFQMIDGPDGNGKLSLREFKDAFGRLGWREFKDSEKAVELFRYLDPDRGGSISWEEWQVMDNLLKELQLAILELLQYVDRTFGSVEVAYEFLDKDGSDSVDLDEWCQAIKSMGYHGPSGVIYKYLCADASTGTLLALSRERWDEVKILWERREAIYQRILQGG
ncbi:unnamed protein product [Symbiodinium microadriaticum]|nr:unnamed protein product [Symbiodinium microadriaticum]